MKADTIVGNTKFSKAVLPLCCYCERRADGPMLQMVSYIAHADCVIRKLNELLDPEYDRTGEPANIVGYLKPVM